MLSDDGGRDWRYAAEAKELQEFLTPEGKGMEYSSSKLSERTNLANTLFSDFWPPELWDNDFLLS